jgi:lipopolysaccharide/colanic/teichoic acid biosynthesis glycosyltransferase
LGEQHSFLELELQLLQKKFKSITFIAYKTHLPREVTEKIQQELTPHTKVLIVLNTKASVPDELLHYLTKIEKDTVKYISIVNFMEKYLKKCYLPSELTDISFLERVQTFSKSQYIQKRLLDYILALLLFVLSAPIVLYSIYRIKKESPGAIFFKQTRVGLKGKEFSCFKFRSMHENSEHNPYTEKDDKRVFLWAKTMRKTRIDEFPQLFNVLRGEMHFIGPRAEWNILVQKYEKEISYYNKRHIVRPGITGWAQVCYPYGENLFDAHQKLMYDLYYIRKWSLLLELKIVCKTIIVILRKQGI